MKISLATSQGSGVISSVNGVNQLAGANNVTARTDVNGKLVFNVESSSKTLSALKVVPTVEKLDGTAGKKSFAATYFYPLQDTDTKVTASNIETRLVSSHIDTTNDYVYLNNTGIQKKFKWDTNDLFFIAGVSVSQDAFEKALSRGDSLSIDYKAKADEKSIHSNMVTEMFTQSTVQQFLKMQ